MKKTLRSAMISTIAMLVVAVVSLTGVTYAWFTQGSTATVNGMNIEVSVAEGGIQIREDQGGSKTPWASTLNLNTGLKNVNPVSSADGVNFFTVTMDDTDSSKYTVEGLGTTDKTNYVITKNLQLTNPGATDVTVVLNATNSTITSVENSSNNNTSTEIYKAARVALIVSAPAEGEGDEGELTTETYTYIWTPHDGQYVALVNTTTTADDYSTAKENVSESVSITSADKCEINLLANPGEAENRFVNVTLVVWLEGQDGDCSNPNAGGAFDIALQFEIKGQ